MPPDQHISVVGSKYSATVTYRESRMKMTRYHPILSLSRNCPVYYMVNGRKVKALAPFRLVVISEWCTPRYGEMTHMWVLCSIVLPVAQFSAHTTPKVGIGGMN